MISEWAWLGWHEGTRAHKDGWFKNLQPFYVTVGNKNDAPDKKVVSTEDARKFADTMHIEFYEASAKDNINVEEVCI